MEDVEKLVGLHFRSVYCVSLIGTKRKIYSSCLITSSTLGLIGSVFQLFLWKGYLRRFEARHKPSSNPHIVFSLAVGNLISTLGSLILGISLLLFDGSMKDGLVTHVIDRQDIYWIFPIQTLSDFGYIATSIWTLIYLVDVCLQVHKVNCRVAVYHVTGWGLTIFFTVLIQVLRFSDRYSLRKCITEDELPNVVIVWISVTMLILIVSSCNLFMIDRQVKADICLLSNAYTSNQRKLMQNVRGKFFFFLFVFLICWISTLFEGVLVIAETGDDVQEALGFAEAILNPLQGAFNYFIFIPLRPGPNPAVSIYADRKSSLLPNGTIQQMYGASYESSLCSTLLPGRNAPIVSSFQFTPCFLGQGDASPLFTSYDQWSHNSQTDSLQRTLRVGNLLGEIEYA